MLHLGRKFVAGTLLGVLAVPGWAQKPATRHTRLTRASAPAKQQPPAAPAQTQAQAPSPASPTPVPLRPEQMPPSLPQVSYQNNQLTISAENSTLSSILWAVRARTGATIEMPPETAAERVAVQLGPGSPREVLAQLLDGSRFDYIIMGSNQDPNAVSQVVLTSRRGAGGAPGGSAAPPTAVAGGGTQAQPPSRMQPPPMPPDEEDEPEPQAEPAPTPPMPAAGQVQPTPIPPTQISPQTPGQPAPGQANPGQSNQVKTPEQLLQELQQMQRQQQGQQQRPQAPPPH
jgi:hypothetical protein